MIENLWEDAVRGSLTTPPYINILYNQPIIPTQLNNQLFERTGHT